MKMSLQLQERDIRVLRELGEVGLLDTELVHQRHFPSVTRRRSQQRLQAFEAHALTRSVSLSVWYGKNGGQVPTIHCLTERGADVVEGIDGIRPRRVARSDPKPETLHHRLAVVKARLAFDDACGKLGLATPEWIMEQDRRADAQPNDPPARRRVLYHELMGAGKKFTCQPDAACLLRVPRDVQRPTVDTTPLLIFWEVDRSTERTGQIVNKCAGYAKLFDRREYRRYWPQAEHAAVRVFWVCQTSRRVESLIAVLREKAVAQAFRFTTADELRPETALRLAIWRTVTGERREILRLPPASRPALEPLGRPAAHLPPHMGP